MRGTRSRTRGRSENIADIAERYADKVRNARHGAVPESLGGVVAARTRSRHGRRHVSQRARMRISSSVRLLADRNQEQYYTNLDYKYEKYCHFQRLSKYIHYFVVNATRFPHSLVV